MDTIVKYRFDREMVSFVKTLDIKTAMFGYDKSDVYDKIKDLLVKARDVCEDLVREAHEEVERMKGELDKAAGDPAPPVTPVSPEPAGSVPMAALAHGQTAESEDTELARLRKEVQTLQESLAEYRKREELLVRAHDIVSEARLEREAIIRNAQKKAEEELFLFRAKQREEEADSRGDLERLDAKKRDIESICAGYQAYAREGQKLFDQLNDYVARLDLIESPEYDEWPANHPLTDESAFDPPVLSADESLSCTEESMPLCELVDEDPEGIFRGQDLADDPSAYENRPEEPDLEAECQHPE
ncbi:MAG: hypothetical protein GX819_01905 [Clostridiaceae bacterium]|nr:hypothetical protein [Clostridiaceae bacterium]